MDESPPSAASPNERLPRAAVAIALTLMLLKFVLISHNEIRAGHGDDYGYAYEASIRHWGVAYRTYAYSRQPVYALFLSLADVFGCPARLWIELAWMGAVSVMLVALRRLEMSASACLVAFALALMFPWTFTLFDKLLCDTLYGALLLAFLCALAAGATRIARPSIRRWGTLAAATGALAANTRLESVLILGALGVAGMCILGLARWAAADRVLTVRRLAWVAILPALAAFGLKNAICLANYKHVRAYVTSDLEMPGFKKLYAELLAIRPAHPDIRLSVPRDAREWAYAHSPTFAQLRPYLDCDPGLAHYQTLPRRRTGVDGEYGAWTVWALRAAAWKLHPWPSARELDAFYAQAAGEIRGALTADPAMARWVPFTFVPPEWDQLPRALCASLIVSGEAMLRADPIREPDAKIDSHGLARFDAIGNRRVPLVQLLNGQPVSGSSWYEPKNIERLDRYKEAINALLKPIVIGSTILTLMGLAVGFVALRRRVFPARWWILSALLITAILGRTLIVAMLHATGMPMQMRYLFPIAAPLVILGVLNAEVLLGLATKRPKPVSGKPFIAGREPPPPARGP